jgi:NurA-like 5'-3' nuclease
MSERRLYEWAKDAKQRNQNYMKVKPQEIISLVELLKGDYKGFSEVAAMLAEELTELSKQHEVYWEEPGESSPALIAYRKLAGNDT